MLVVSFFSFLIPFQNVFTDNWSKEKDHIATVQDTYHKHNAERLFQVLSTEWGKGLLSFILTVMNTWELLKHSTSQFFLVPSPTGGEKNTCIFCACVTWLPSLLSEFCPVKILQHISYMKIRPVLNNFSYSTDSFVRDHSLKFELWIFISPSFCPYIDAL